MAILHKALPFKVWMDPRLSRMPGIQPLDPADWLQVDEVYEGQMEEKARLMAADPDRVHALLPQARAAALELMETVIARLPALGFAQLGSVWVCPDGRRVAIDHDAPLLTLGRLVQEDLCILQDGSDGHHVLTGAILCFPASWTLSEKIGRGLPGIHTPVARYDAGVTARVQRLFDAIRPEQPLWRANALDYGDPALHQPRREGEETRRDTTRTGFIRSERQCLLRLPRSGAVVFSIHTYVVRRDCLNAEEEAAFVRHRA